MNSNNYSWIALEIAMIIFFMVMTFAILKINSSLRGELSRHREYEIHLVTNDKDTLNQEIPVETIREQMNGICAKYVDSFTVSVAETYSRDDNGNLTHETTLIYVFLDAPIDSIQQILDEALTKFNRSSILLEENRGRSAFYSGRKQKN